MPDFERLIDSLRIRAAPSESTREWARGFAAGKKRARLEVLSIVLVLYFSIALIGALSRQ